MSWLDTLSSLFGQAPPAPAPDARNFLLARQLAERGLDNPARQPAALLAAAQAAFPGLTATAGQALLHELDEVQRRAYDLASAVNRHELAEAEAHQQLQAAFPQLTPDNRRRLLTQALINTR
jgi:hypothetical protein